MFSSGFSYVVAMSLVVGAASYGVGLVPLSMPLSKKQIIMLSDLGTGLLIGTALGVILPEGVEQIVVNAGSEHSSYSFTIGVPTLLGFGLMFLMEEYTTSHEQPPAAPHSLAQPEGPIFDVNLEELGHHSSLERPPVRQAEACRLCPISLGLVLHALIDGYALGVSASNTRAISLSLVVFLAIIIHKAPTALSLTTTLIANSISVVDCKKHLLYFSLATPVSAVLSFGLYAFQGSESPNAWLGNALLFSGGTFLYVASVIHPASSHDLEPPANKTRKVVRTILVVGGMFFPVLVSRFVMHEFH